MRCATCGGTAHRVVTTVDHWGVERVVGGHVGTCDCPSTDLDTFETHYVIAMLWSSTDTINGEESVTLDRDHDVSDLAPETIERVKADCKDFREECGELLDLAGDVEQNGHDFWLTRNGHGAGFWDRGYPAGIANALTEICERFGEQWPYVGDDGLIYLG